MQTFRLDAVDAGRSSPHWGCSSLAPGTVWVAASGEEEARDKVTAATITGRPSKLGDDSPLPPWKQPDLVTCTADDTRTVPNSFVIAANGTVLEPETWQ
jgi:hypothetical protein